MEASTTRGKKRKADPSYHVFRLVTARSVVDDPNPQVMWEQLTEDGKPVKATSSKAAIGVAIAVAGHAGTTVSKDGTFMVVRDGDAVKFLTRAVESVEKETWS